jgi:hypothetical protein
MADLVQLQRDFLAAEERWRIAAAGGDAEATTAAYQEAHRLATELHRHPWMNEVETRHQARMALCKVAAVG